MYIRRVRSHTKRTGESYFTHRLVRTERVGEKVRQVTLLNLGRHFATAEDDWALLCARIEEIVSGQSVLLALDPTLEGLAQHYGAQLLLRQGQTLKARRSGAALNATRSFIAVDAESLEVLEPRSVGVEHAGLSVMREIGFIDELYALGFNQAQCAAAVGNLIARMAAPGSELATWGWLRQESGLGELIEFDFSRMPLMRLYRASDLLLRHQGAIEAFVFERVRGLFGLASTVSLYDLTNTYFEGTLRGNPKAARGHSKEKRTDCVLLTLALVLDQSGFVKRSQVFAGNAVEARTLEVMLRELHAPRAALVVMDRGIATEENLVWLNAHGYRYVVVSREKARQFDAREAVEITAASGARIRLQKCLSAANEVRLYCHSPGREQKETAITTRLTQRFEQGLAKIAHSLTKPRGEKRLSKITERIGRLKQQCFGIGQHYRIDYQTDATTGSTLTALTWSKHIVPGSQLSDPGVYCLRSNETTWSAEQLWRTYVMLTDLEAVFRSLKSELGLRPIFHRKQARGDGHLFISVLAYQFVQIIRTRLADRGIHDSWISLRKILQVQRRTTSCFNTRGGRTLSVRKASKPETPLAELYAALALPSNPGGTVKRFE
jgi:hypothetical protein